MHASYHIYLRLVARQQKGAGGAGAVAAGADGAASSAGLPQLPLHRGAADGRPLRNAQGKQANTRNVAVHMDVIVC